MQKTLVTFLLDKSGSMGSIRDTTIEGFNEYLHGLQSGDAADSTEFTFLQFDSFSIDKIHLAAPVKEVPDLETHTYIPRGFTPLIEALTKTIRAVERSVAGTDKKVVICSQTDGQENASGQEYTVRRLNDLIKEKEALGWQFNFMGVGIDAYAQAQQMGISAGSTISTTLNPGQMKAAYRAMGASAAMYAAGATHDTKISMSAKAAAGDYTATPPKKPAAPSVKSRVVLPQNTGTPKVADIVPDFDLDK